MTTKTTTNPYPDVVPPAGWDSPPWGTWVPGCREDTRPWRLIYSAEHPVTDHDACVQLRAVQYADGTVADFELLLNDDDELNSDQARELAAALLEAAAEIDRWAGQ